MDDDQLPVADRASIVGQHRGPRQAKIWEESYFESSRQPIGSTKSAPDKASMPIFISSDSEPEDQVLPVKKGTAYEDYLRFTGQLKRRATTSQAGKPRPRKKSPVFESPEKFREVVAGPSKKRSLFDEQPDARRISFDSQTRESSPAKRQRRSPSTKESDGEFLDDFEPMADPERVERSRTSAAERRPAPTASNKSSDHKPRRSTSVERILDRIHGFRTQKNRVYADDQPVRKGRGFEWTPEQEAFLIRKIEEYGPQWADMARKYCAAGQPLEGRDQTKLKDKARNIKEKYIRYEPSLSLFLRRLIGREGRKFPRNFTMITPIGNFNEAKARMEAHKKI